MNTVVSTGFIVPVLKNIFIPYGIYPVYRYFVLILRVFASSIDNKKVNNLDTPSIYSKYDVHWDESICALLCPGQRVSCCEFDIRNRAAAPKRQVFWLLAALETIFGGAAAARSCENLYLGFSRRAYMSGSSALLFLQVPPS